jgi:hypothetical protein
MDTGRAHVAMGALMTQKKFLENRLAMVESALEREGRRSMYKPRDLSKKGKKK